MIPPGQSRPFLGRMLIAISGMVFIIVFGYFGYAVVSANLAQTRVAELFQPVTATVIASKVTSYSTNHLQTYDVQVTYRYRVAAHDYQSHRYAYTYSGFKDYNDAKKTAAQYHAGRKITVYYDPVEPASAVIIRQPPALPTMALIVPFALFLLMGCLIMIHGIRGILNLQANPE